MTWTPTPYGPTPPGLENKAMRSISADEAYRLATPSQRRAWFGDGDGPPIKAAAQYDPPTGLPPHLEARRAEHQAMTYGDQADPVCANCRSAYAPGHGTVNGYCAHRSPPGVKALKLAEARQAEATLLEQQAKAGMLGNPVRVVSVGQAAAEDSLRAELHQMVDDLLG